jgi:hypothetical protein
VTPAAGVSAVPAGKASSASLPGGIGIIIPWLSPSFPIVDIYSYSQPEGWMVVARLFRRFLFGVTYVEVR